MYIESFLKYLRCELNLSDHTVLAYGRDVRQWHDFAASAGLVGCDVHNADPDPKMVTVNDLRLWIAFMSSEGMTQRSIRRKIQSVRAFYKFLMRCHGLENNPAADLAPARMPKTLPAFIRQDEMAHLLDDGFDGDDFESVRNHLILDMLYSTGMRVSELVGLLDVDVDVCRGELKVLGKRNKERLIPFGAEMQGLIDMYRRLRHRDASGCASGEFFVRIDGRPMHRRGVYKIVHDALDGRVSAQKKSPHVLRHSFATDMLNNGAEMSAVQQLLGHQSLSTTQIYTHLSYREILNNYKLAHPRAQKSGG